MWRSALSVVAFPLLALAPGAIALHLAAPDVPGAPRDPAADGALFLALAAATYATIALLERVIPYRPEWNRPQGDVGADTLHLLVSGPGSSALGGLLVGGALAVAGGPLSAHLGFGLWPGGWPVVVQVALAVTIAELGHYAFHRLSHESALVWRLHAVHHSAPRLHWLNAVRFHPGDLVTLTFVQSLPLFWLGIPAHTYLIYVVVAGCYGQLQHANVELRTGPLSYLWSTPELHRWHHSTDPREGNQNYGAIVSLWDLVFRTFHRPRDRRFSGAVGIAGMPDFPRTWAGHMLAPLRWRALAGGARTPGPEAAPPI